MNYKMSRYFNKNTFLFVMSIVFFFLVIIVIGLTKDKFNSNSNSVSLTGTNSIHISNKLPLTDESGRTLDASNVNDDILNEISFSVESTGDTKIASNYEVYLESDENDDTIDPNYVKVYLTDGDGKAFKDYSGNEVMTYRNLRVSKSSASGKLLYSGTIFGNQKQEFKLRLWLDETYFLSDTKKEFNGIIKVKKLS
ncbi:MAG: hypothetical protein SPJ06_02875 [Bacilli bacterium]|nr:hypothetical protein [bacterium]MDY5992919.1 hypothetical protein [Bacilli bacterium]